MQQIILPCHPLTRRVLIAEYGQEPILLPNRDLLFSLINTTPLRSRVSHERAFEVLTSTISLQVHDRLAARLKNSWDAAGFLLLKFHKDAACRYVSTMYGLGQDARPALQDWLKRHSVEEDDYSLDSAYKMWQRWIWDFSGKNKEYIARKRDQTAGGQKVQAKAVALAKMPADQAAVARDRFLAIAPSVLPTVPKVLYKHVHLYYLCTLCGLSQRKAAAAAGIGRRETVRYAVQTISNWRDTNRDFAALLLRAAAFRAYTGTDN
jgi:hypothetical protein